MGDFMQSTRDCAAKLGKDNFFLPGELTSGNKVLIRLIAPVETDGSSQHDAADALPTHLPLESLLNGVRNGASAGLARGVQYGSHIGVRH